MSGADFGRHLSAVRTGGLQLHCPHSDAQTSYSTNLGEDKFSEVHIQYRA
jgi:hypothetical protein